MITVRGILKAPFIILRLWSGSKLGQCGIAGGGPRPRGQKILTTLDITESVVDEAVQTGADLIVAHHPVMNCTWHPVQTLRTDDRQGRILTGLVEKYFRHLHAHESGCSRWRCQRCFGGKAWPFADRIPDR